MQLQRPRKHSSSRISGLYIAVWCIDLSLTWPRQYVELHAKLRSYLRCTMDRVGQYVCPNTPLPFFCLRKGIALCSPYLGVEMNCNNRGNCSSVGETPACLCDPGWASTACDVGEIMVCTSCSLLLICEVQAFAQVHLWRVEE